MGIALPSVAGLKKEVLSAVHGRLTKLSMRRHESGLYTCDLGIGVLGWLGLNMASYPHESVFVIHPNVGVCHEDLERIVAGLTGRRYDPHSPPTVAEPLYVLAARTPPNISWAFELGRDASPVIDDMMRAFVAYGLPFMRKHMTLEAMLPRLETQSHGPNEIYSLPVTYLLLGTPERGREVVQLRLQETQALNDRGTEFYRRFAAAYLARASS